MKYSYVPFHSVPFRSIPFHSVKYSTRERRVEESAAIAGVRVIAMLSTYSDLDDEGSSDDLESEVECADLTSRRQRHQQPVRFSTLTSARSGSQGTMFYQIRNDLSQFVVKLQEHGQRVNLKF